MAIRNLDNPPFLDASALTTNPSTDDVIADTGAVATGGLYEIRILVGQSAAARYKVERRNAANGDNVGDVSILYGAAGQTAQYVLNYALAASERVRVVMQTSLTGTCAATITHEALS